MRIGRQQGLRTAQIVSIPAPVRGWNARDALSEMRPDDAVRLDNWFPQATDVRLRRGYQEWATGVGSGDVESIMDYSWEATNNLLAASGGEIYDATAEGPAVSLASGYASDRWQHVNFGGYLLAVNGSDDPIKYDGSTIATNTITGSGLTPSDLINIAVHKNRVWFVEQNTMNAWFLPAGDISGTASEFDISGYTTRGGVLVAIAPWTVDAGSGIDDFLCFITSEGEVLVYQGTDPSDATQWTLQGVYRIPKPIGLRCTTKLAGELLIVTESATIPLSKMIVTDQAIAKRIAITDRISQAFAEAGNLYKANFGWQATVHPSSNMLLVNIPASGDTFYQYTMNTETGAWCRFTGLNAPCWVVLNGSLYFGGIDGTVYLANTGQNDNGANIEADVQTSFQLFSGPITKSFVMVQPQIQSGQNPALAVLMLVDFQDLIPLATTVSANTQAQWDVALWDVGLWGGEEVIADWIGVTGVGKYGSVRIRSATMGLDMKFIRCGIMYKPGGLI